MKMSKNGNSSERRNWRASFALTGVVIAFALTGCGGASKDASAAVEVVSPPSNAVLSPSTLAERIQILRDLLDQELRSASAGRARRLNFFKAIAPAVVETMLEVETERAKVFEYSEAVGRSETIPASLKADISLLFQRYKTDDIDELKVRVDVIPIDMLFTQAAVESASGTSAVAKDCHNIFGVHAAARSQACPGHPILAYYSDFTGSIKRYVLLLNAGSAYKAFRRDRTRLRSTVGEHGALDSDVLVEGLLPYSERGKDYVRSIAAGIQSDHLDQLYREYVQRIN